MKKNLLVGQSGGPTAVINASLYGVISEALESAEIDRVLGMVNGIQGFLKDNIIDLGIVPDKKERELLKTTPAAFLGSCRFKLPKDLDDPLYTELFEKFEAYDIGYVLYIGGNDSMDTAAKLSQVNARLGKDIRFIGVPKTIDNDLVATDHTPGYGSAAKFVATVVREITMDAEVYDAKSITVVEIMGRSAGWLTAASALARRFEGDNPCLIYLPETNFDVEQFIKRVQECLKERMNLVVCVSEGIHDADGKLICEYDTSVGLDAFGHKMLAGAGKYLENLVRGRLDIKARSVELNVVQRCHSALISATDMDEAVMQGRAGVRAALRGESGHMIGLVRVSEKPYKVETESFDVVAIGNAVKEVPREWINEAADDVETALVDYMKPLICGSVNIPEKDGMPLFAKR